MNLWLTSILYISIILLSLISFISCGDCGPCPLGSQVVVTSPDNTGPDFVTVFATFADETQSETSVTQSSQSVEVSVLGDDVITFVASGGDPQGARTVRFWVEETFWRTTGGITEQVGPGLLAEPAAQQEITASPGDNVCTPLRVTHEIRIADRRGNFDRIRIRVWSEAINFSGTNAISRSLTLNWP